MTPFEIDPEEAFLSLCCFSHHRENSAKLFRILPDKVRKRMIKHYIHVTDFFDRSIDPNVSIDGERLAYFIERGRAIYLVPKNIFSTEAFMGLLAHEIAHAYIFHSSPIVKLISKLYYKLKFINQSQQIKQRYRLYEKQPEEEYHADCLVCKWGFKDYQNKLWAEMCEKAK